MNTDTGYIDKISRVEISHKNLRLIKEIVQNKLVKNPIYVIVSNQSGVARGYFSIEVAYEIMDFVVKEIEYEIPVSAFYFSPFHLSASNLFQDPLEADSYRKPNPGMMLQAKNDFKLDLVNSLMFGDKITDQEAAINSGISKENIFLI